MIHTVRQLKDLIHNLSRQTGVESYILLRRYMMERFLERVALSLYRDSFILKGGVLVSSLVGVEMRTTMDLDSTVKALPVSVSDMGEIIQEIISVPLDDAVAFHVKGVTDIIDEDEYGGLRVSMEARLEDTVIPLKIDISTGDAIYPGEVQYSYPLMFEDRSISLTTYPLETVLAEKLETALSRSVTNTRMRDFYDMHILLRDQGQNLHSDSFRKAVLATAQHRGSENNLNKAESILTTVSENSGMRQLWQNYQSKYSYASECSWGDVIGSVRSLCELAGLLSE